MAAPLSQAVCDRLRKLCEVHSQQDAAMIVGVNPTTVTRIKQRGWKVPRFGRPLKPRPSDFAINCQHMSFRELARHYGATNYTLIKWLEGVERTYEPKQRDSTAHIPPREVLEQAAVGRSWNEVARFLGVNPKTVRRWRIYHGMEVEVRKNKRPEPVKLPKDWAAKIFAKAA